MNALNRSLKELKGGVSSIGGFLDESWYECWGLGKWQRQRVMISKVDAFMNTAFDRVAVVMESCTNEDFEESHDNLMKATKEKTLDVLTKILGILDMVLMATK